MVPNSTNRHFLIQWQGRDFHSRHLHIPIDTQQIRASSSLGTQHPLVCKGKLLPWHRFVTRQQVRSRFVECLDWIVARGLHNAIKARGVEYVSNYPAASQCFHSWGASFEVKFFRGMRGPPVRMISFVFCANAGSNLFLTSFLLSAWGDSSFGEL